MVRTLRFLLLALLLVVMMTSNTQTLVSADEVTMDDDEATAAAAEAEAAAVQAAEAAKAQAAVQAAEAVAAAAAKVIEDEAAAAAAKVSEEVAAAYEAALQAQIVKDEVERLASEALTSSVFETKETSTDNDVVRIKSKISTFVEKIVSESSGIVDKCKSMDPATAKKVAAGLFGAWGVAAGAGWLAGSAGKESVIATAAKVEKRK